MLLAVHRCLAVLYIKVCTFSAGIVRATRRTCSYHSILSMFLAEGRRSAARDVIGRVLCAGAMRATTAKDVHHAVVSMLPAVTCCLAAFHIEDRPLHAGGS